MKTSHTYPKARLADRMGIITGGKPEIPQQETGAISDSRGKPSTMSKEPKQVLCIEDNSVNMLLVSRIVEAEGHELIQAADGASALDILSDTVPDIILLDINLPGIDGLELARRIRADEKLASIPLIATTAQVLVGDRERCLEAGCDDYLPKPLDIRKLREVMRSYLNHN
jgi:two-component system cell cycle response regulator DivK